MPQFFVISGRLFMRTKTCSLLAVAVLLTITLFGCGVRKDKNAPASGALLPESGTYEAAGNYDEIMTPYISLNTEDKTFSLSGGMALSYAEFGTFDIYKDKLVARSPDATYEFGIIDGNTLLLLRVSGGENSVLSVNTKFVCNK